MVASVQLWCVDLYWKSGKSRYKVFDDFQEAVYFKLDMKKIGGSCVRVVMWEM